jgi:hypothetical protein
MRRGRCPQAAANDHGASRDASGHAPAMRRCPRCVGGCTGVDLGDECPAAGAGADASASTTHRCWCLHNSPMPAPMLAPMPPPAPMPRDAGTQPAGPNALLRVCYRYDTNALPLRSVGRSIFHDPHMTSTIRSVPALLKDNPIRFSPILKRSCIRSMYMSPRVGAPL